MKSKISTKHRVSIWRSYVFTLALILTGFCINLNAQNASQYIFSSTSGTYTPLTLPLATGAILGTPTANSLAGSLDDNIYTVSFPFSFYFSGNAYTSCKVSTNGFITFGTTAPGTGEYTPISATTGYNGAVSGFARDLNTVYNIASDTGSLRWDVVGTAPNREIVVEWKSWRPAYTTSTTNAFVFNMQIRLEESTNTIRIVYGPSSYLIGSTNISNTVQVGLRGATNTDYNNRTTASANWSVTAAGTANGNTLSYSTAGTVNFPTSGLTFTYNLPACTGTPLGGNTVISTAPSCGGNFVLNVTGSTGSYTANNTFQWQDSIPGGTWNNLATSLGAAHSDVTSSLSVPTYFRRIVTCTGSGLSAQSAPVLVVPITGGTASSTNAICGDSITLSLTGNTTGAGLTYQWEESLDSAVWNPIAPGTTAPFKTPSPTVLTYYRAQVTCVGSAYSVPVKVLPVVVNGGTASATNAICGDSITLSLTGNTTGPGITYQWEESPDSSVWTPIPSATTAPKKIPSPTAVTFYRVQVSCASSAYSTTVKVLPIITGTANSTIAICGDSITLSLTGNSSGPSIVYQWEESTDSAVWNPIATATTATSKIPSPVVNTFYRNLLTCGAANGYSTVVKVFAVKGGTTAITSSICNDSTLLSLTGSTTGSITYQWLSSADSIVWTPVSGVTTSTYKFPTPLTNTYFRATLTCGSNSDSSVAVKVIDACSGFRYSIARNTAVPFTSIQSTGTAFTWAGTSADDDRSQPVQFPSGFNFIYNGSARGGFYVSTNGWLSLDTTVLVQNGVPSYTNNLNNTSPRLVLAPFWEDMVALGNTAANRSYIKYEVSGTTPNRVLTVEWAEMERFLYSSPSLNFQVKIYEGTNNIEYVYGKMQAFDGNGTGDFSYSIGMTGANISAGQRLALYVENTSNFRQTPTFDNNTIVPLCNTSYLFTAGGVFNPTSTSAIPANDSSSTPVVLAVNPTPCTDACGTYYSSRGATASGTAIAPVSGTPDDDVWFKFTAPVSGQVNIAIFSSSGYNPAFQVMTSLFDTAGLGTAASVNANTNALESVLATTLVPGNDYLIRVFHAGTGAGSTSGAFSLCVNEVIPPPVNDNTAGAIVLTPALTCTPTASTTLGASASPQPVCGGLADDDVWFRFIPNSAVDTITVDGSGTFRAHVQVLNNSMASLYCLNTAVNGGAVQVIATGLLKDSTYWIRVYHTNAGTASANFDICVTGDNATAPLVRTEAAAGIIDVTAQISGTILSSGGFPVTKSGIVFGTSPLPVIGDPGVVDSITTPLITNGTFSFNLSGLTPLTTYYYRVYAINGMGTTYGGDSSFTTTAGPVAPSVETVLATSYTQTSVTIGADLQFSGGAAVTASGILFGTSSASMVIGDPSVIDSVTTPPVTSGIYSFNLTGLTAGTVYYFRAYAINSAGTGYSAIDSFMTDPILTSLPYNQNFDGYLNTGWHAMAIAGNNWVLGTPAKTFINAAHSGTKAWLTKLTGNYDASIQAAVLSPKLDFSAVTTDPILRFYHKFVTEGDFDALVVEVSVNGGGTWKRLNPALGTGANYNTDSSLSWYNHGGTFGPIAGPKFSSLTTAIGSDAIYASQVNGWIQSSTVIAGVAGQSDVRVRFLFGSDISGQQEGWALDDITIEEVVVPSAAATAVTPSNMTNTTTDVAWANGNGVARLVVARLTSTPAVAPADIKIYNPNTVFGNPDSTGTGNYVVFNGTASAVSVTNLALATNYTYDVYEYNGTNMHIRYGAAASNNATTLPVTLTSFAAIAKTGDVLLSWSTASETNNKGFEIERSVDGRTFEQVDFVKGAGNSSRKLGYSLTDAKAFTEANSNVLYYRLKQVDFDGKYAYSQVVRVNRFAEKANAISVYPNPFDDSYGISFETSAATTATITMTDLQGRVVADQTVSTLKGNNMISMENLDGLQTGVYFVKVTVEGETQVLKLVKN